MALKLCSTLMLTHKCNCQMKLLGRLGIFGLCVLVKPCSLGVTTATGLILGYVSSSKYCFLIELYRKHSNLAKCSRLLAFTTFKNLVESCKISFIFSILLCLFITATPLSLSGLQMIIVLS